MRPNVSSRTWRAKRRQGFLKGEGSGWYPNREGNEPRRMAAHRFHGADGHDEHDSGVAARPGAGLVPGSVAVARKGTAGDFGDLASGGAAGGHGPGFAQAVRAARSGRPMA